MPVKPDEGAFWQSLSPAEHVARYEAQGMDRMEAMKAAAKDRGMRKSALYQLLLKEKED